MISHQAAILRTLGLLIGKGAAMLKPFVPQLQTTFVKALSDPSKRVRANGSSALSLLVVLSTRIEPLVTELTNLLGGAEAGAAYSVLCALSGVLRNMTKPVSEALLDKVVAALASCELQGYRTHLTLIRGVTCVLQGGVRRARAGGAAAGGDRPRRRLGDRLLLFS